MNRLLKSILLAAVCAWGTSLLRAVPELQLDILGGTYDPVSESTVANSSVFTLRALLKGSSNLPGPYFIAAAIQPGLPQNSANVGSFSFNGNSYSTATMSWGVPPLDVSDTKSGNLPKHGVYPTYYHEEEFFFSSSATVASYNVETDAAASGRLYYHDFTIDVSGLLPGYYVHFDLYDLKVKKGNYTLDDFAPFSHDAQSRPGTSQQIPDSGSTAVLLGLGFIGAAFLGRRLAKA